MTKESKPAIKADAVEKVFRDMASGFGKMEAMVDTRIGETVRALAQRGGDVTLRAITADLQARIDARNKGGKYDPTLDAMRAMLESAITALQTASGVSPPAAAPAQKPRTQRPKPDR